MKSFLSWVGGKSLWPIYGPLSGVLRSLVDLKGLKGIFTQSNRDNVAPESAHEALSVWFQGFFIALFQGERSSP